MKDQKIFFEILEEKFSQRQQIFDSILNIKALVLRVLLKLSFILFYS